MSLSQPTSLKNRINKPISLITRMRPVLKFAFPTDNLSGNYQTWNFVSPICIIHRSTATVSQRNFRKFLFNLLEFIHGSISFRKKLLHRSDEIIRFEIHAEFQKLSLTSASLSEPNKQLILIAAY